MNNYPSPPAQINLAISEPSPLYKKELTKSVLSILFFILSYFVLVTLGAFLAYMCIRLGLAIISSGLHVLVLVAGGGVILIGVFIFYFLVKFIFSSHKTDRSILLEIKREDQPELFEFIKRITEETQSPFPKKIFLSNEVNASVFYDSSFWSMFMPIQKNLLIGLGLVNSVSISEFKGILAHEFGHFSQRSMKVGSYVYNSNRIIYNLLYENTGFFNTLSKVAGVHFILYFCMQIVAGVVNVIQKVLNKLYLFMNVQNSKLSREMEFHADSVAAMVSGSKPLINALYRLELAESAFSQTLEVCNLLLDENKRDKNIFPAHRFVMNELAVKNNIPIVNQHPMVNKDTFSMFNFNKVNIENQWASHPETSFREKALLKLNVETKEIYETAWVVFRNAEDLQVKMTQLLYQNAPIEEDKLTSGDFIIQKYADQCKHFELPSETKGYWDFKKIPVLNLDELETNGLTSEWYSDEDSKMNMKLSAIEQDMALLQGIMDKQIKPSSIEFLGEKYPRSEAGTLHATLAAEKEALIKSIQAYDKMAILNHYLRAKQKDQQELFKSVYDTLINSQNDESKAIAYREKIMNLLQPLFEGQELSIEFARDMIGKIQNEELKLKSQCKSLIESPEIVNHLKPHTINRLKTFIDSIRVYFIQNTFQDVAISELISTSNFILDAYAEWQISLKRKLLSF